MREYRRTHAEYRERERLRARSARAATAGCSDVMEAGCKAAPVEAFAVFEGGKPVGLRLVTHTGKLVTLRVPEEWLVAS